MKKVIYSTDVNTMEHANYFVDSEKNVFYIERYEDEDKVIIYSLELFSKPSDSFINDNDINSLNSYSDSNYEYTKTLIEDEQYLFTFDLCSYYGGLNFDSNPLELSYEEFEQWFEENFIEI